MLAILQRLKSLQKAPLGAFFPGLSVTKGLLQLFVILSHTLPPSMALFVIYFFAMPLFLSISGFLIKISTYKNGLRALLKKLTFRLFIPWLIAFVIYIPIVFKERSLSSFSFYDIIYPYFHLWYVPAYVVGVVFCYTFLRFKITTIFAFFITIAFTAFWFLTYRDTKVPISELPLYFLGEKRFFSYVSFFFIGFAIRNYFIKFRPSFFYLLFMMGIAATPILVVFGFKFSEDFILPSYIIINICLIFLFLLYIGPIDIKRNKFMQFVNEQSLGIYLYHPMVIYLIYSAMDDPEMKTISNFTGVVVFFITTAITSGVVWTLNKFEFTQKYMLGIVKKEALSDRQKSSPA